MSNNAKSPAKSLDEGEHLLPIQNSINQTLVLIELSLPPLSPLPPLPSLPLSEPAAFALADPSLPQAKAHLSKDMPHLQPGRSQAKSTKGRSNVLLSSRLDYLRALLYLDTRRLYPTCCLFGRGRNPSLT